ncbi:MAG: hypothetical protein M0Z39_05275 [Actinomycetota bacterium]|nr:hypothetical protein [Actinomycetota bacterium]
MPFSGNVIYAYVIGEWEGWLDFFPEDVIVTVSQAVETARQLLGLSRHDRIKINTLGRPAEKTTQAHRALMEQSST